MWKMLLLVIVIAAIAFVGLPAFKSTLRSDPALNIKVAELNEKIDSVRTGVAYTIEELRKRAGDINSIKNSAAKDILKKEEPRGITIYMKHGSVISGKLLEERETEYEVEWKGGRSVLLKSQVARVEFKDASQALWPYKNNIVVKKTGGVVLDGDIIGADKDKITMSFSEGGGEMEMAVDRKDVSHLIFAPVCTRESEETEARLKNLFPRMSLYREDNFTLITDSKPEWIKSYTKELNGRYTDIYLRFFKLFKGRKQQGQNFVVLFDDKNDYYKYMLASTGQVSYGMVGYFRPDGRTLYIYNSWGGWLEKYYFDYVTRLCNSLDDWAKKEKEQFKDSSGNIVIDGYCKETQDVFWNWYSLHKNLALDETFETMRHEFTHEVFHNWGLQTVVVSKTAVDKDKMSEKEKEILDTLDSQDDKKIENLFKELFRLKKGYYEGLELGAANSWLAEGMALYCETTPMGAVNEERLFRFQEMAKKGAVNPLEFLTNFKKGSFSGLDIEAVLDGYAESWAFTSFLMEKYPEQFIKYQSILADQIAGNAKEAKENDDFALLLKCLGKSLPELEKEFSEFMKTFKQIDDPDVNRFLKYQKMHDDFENVQRQERKFYILR